MDESEAIGRASLMHAHAMALNPMRSSLWNICCFNFRCGSTINC